MWRAAIVFLLLFSSVAGAEPLVRSVDVYPKGGRIVFEAPVEPKGGTFSIELPGAFDPESVRVLNPLGAENLRVKMVSRAPWVPVGLEPLKARLDTLNAELASLEGRVAALQQTRKMLVIPSTLKDFGARDLIAYIEGAQTLRTTVENEMVTLDERMKKATEERDRLQSEYDGKSPYNAELALQVSGRLFNPGPALIEAFTPSIAWSLHYSMDMNSNTGDIEARMYALTQQRTGLDLKGGFVFHTRRPAESVQPPSVKPLVVDFEKKVSRNSSQYSARSAAPMPMARLEEMDGRAFEDEFEELLKSRVNAEPEVSSTLSDVTVRGDGVVTGDGSPVDVVLGSFTLKSVPDLVLIPEQRSESWIVASMDSVPESLLPGRADLLVDGQPSGRTSIPEYGLEQMRLPFGMATRLSAGKTQMLGTAGSSFFGGSGILHRGYEIKVTSGLESEREVSVLDRLPVPVNEKIKLENVKIDPEPTKRDKENRLTWKMTLKPGETRKIVVEYTLTYPSDETLTYR
ncbi:MAG: DUF4139 domain-containing protein [Fretibacterium sp.]|nr:DUF4139 domain-containing protein [Fretibacterium sp.]